MPATIHRLPSERPAEQCQRRPGPRREDIQATVALLLDDPHLSEDARAELQGAAYRYTESVSPAAAPRWVFVMINPDQVLYVLRAIQATPKPATTHRVWIAALAHIRMDTGEIMAGRERLAKDALTTPQEVSRSMGSLVDIGAVSKIRRGKRTVYFVNPNVGWAGSEPKRRRAAKRAPELRLVATAEE